MANAHTLMGEVTSMKVYNFTRKDGSQGQIMHFSILSQFDGRKSYLECRTGVAAIIETIKQGMLIELDNYYPYKNIWKDKETEEIRSRMELYVFHIKVIKMNGLEGVEFLSPQQQKEYKYEKFVAPKEEEEKINLDWLKDFSNDKDKINRQRAQMLEQQQQIINNQKPISTQSEVNVNVEEFEKDRTSGHSW